MTDEERYSGLVKLVQLVKPVEEEKINERADLKADLGFDEVDRLELLMMAERYFDVAFSDGEIDFLSGFGDILDAIAEYQKKPTMF